MTSQQVVFVGSGQGGFQVAASLRDMGFDDPVTIVGKESGLPYQRPPLSKAFLTGKVQEEQLLLRPASFFESRNISLVAPERVQAIARASIRSRYNPGDACTMTTWCRPLAPGLAR